MKFVFRIGLILFAMIAFMAIAIDIEFVRIFSIVMMFLMFFGSNYRWFKIVLKLDKLLIESTLSHAETVLKVIFEGSEITCYIVQFDEKRGYVIKLGDDDHIMEYGFDLFNHGKDEILEKVLNDFNETKYT